MSVAEIERFVSGLKNTPERLRQGRSRTQVAPTIPSGGEIECIVEAVFRVN